MINDAMGAGPEGANERPPIVKVRSIEDLAARFDLVKIYRGILRRLWIVILSAILFTLGTGFFAKKMQSSYIADSYIIFEVTSSRLIPESLPIGHLTLASAVEMVTLPQHLNAVRSILGLNLTEQQLLKMIDVKPPLGDSNLIDITVSADNPSLAMDVANTLASVVVKDAQELAKRQLKASYDYLATRVQNTRDKIDQKVKEIADFRQQHSFLDVTPDGLLAMRNAQDLDKRLQEAVTTYNSLLIEYENLRREASRIPDQVLKTSMEENPLKQRLAQTQIALLEARTRYAPENPKIKILEAQLQELQAMLAKPAQDNPENQPYQQYEANPLKQTLNMDLVNLRGKVRSAQKQKEDVEVEYGRMQKQLANLPQEEAQFGRLLDQKTRMEEDLKDSEAVMKVAEMMLKLGKGDLDLYANATKAEPDNSLVVQLLPLIGFLVGIFFGLSLAAFLEIVDPKIRTPTEVDNSYNVPCIMTIPELTGMSAGKAEERLKFFISYLEAAIIRQFQGSSHFTVALTSSSSGEGKSTLTYCLARYWQRFGKRVVVVEMDPLPNPMFNQEAMPSQALEEYLVGQASLEQVLHQGEISRLKVGSEANMKELLRRGQLPSLMAELQKRFDIVIIDAPGVVERDYTLDTLRVADAVLFVIGSCKMTRNYIDSSLHECDLAGIRPFGILLNRALKIFVDDVRVQSEAQRSKEGIISKIRSLFSGK